MGKYSIALQMFQELTAKEQARFLEAVADNKSVAHNGSHDLEETILKHNHTSTGDRPPCPHCGSEIVKKNGRLKGRQRYQCKTCGSYFVITSSSILYASKKDPSTWEKFMECMMDKFSLRKSAARCGISVPTAFIWRQKILGGLQKIHESVVLKGVVQTDETFFPVSYKGNHTKSKFKMPRRSHKRGLDTHVRGISRQKACVTCSVTSDGHSIGMISNLGRPNAKTLGAVLNGKVEEGSIFVTDGLTEYSKIAKTNGLTHIRIPKGQHTNGIFNIQTVNAYHKELKRLVLKAFSGVATKYLNNYVVFHNFVNFAKHSFSEKLDILVEHTFSTPLLEKCKEISVRPAIPLPLAA